MAIDKIVVPLEVTSNGTTEKETAKAEKLRAALENAGKAASRTGGTAGSRAAAAGYRAEMSGEEYRQAKGVAGLTGSSSRDFAKESQGLGGLVRLYATYAANVFAVSAAFTALRDAMSTQNMIKGLDQLGAASGIAMGGLAKRFADASEGAISLRESMEATAKAVSSGMTQKQFMQLGDVAKKASQALGLNMSDAVSRLTRGITKLEPELLDELGLFTKVGKATEDYARSVNKSVDSLTDFEKRQAFANAVLKEGIDKFGALDVAANPYDKLLASLKNTALEILGAINSIVAPIAKLFAENTGLITAAIALMAVKLVQQALPALTGWRRGLKLAADDAVKAAQDINTSFGEAFVERTAAKFKLPQLQDEIKGIKAELAAVDKEFTQTQAYKRPKQSSVLKSVNENRLMNEREMAIAEKEVAKYSDRTDEASKKHAATLARKVELQKQLTDKMKLEAKLSEDVVQASSKESMPLTGEWQREEIVKNARQRAASLGLLDTVSKDVTEKGLFGGLSGFYSDVKANKDLSNLSKLKTAAIGTFAGIATASQILFGSLSRIFGYVEILAAAFGMLHLIYGENSKQVDIFNSSISNLNETVKTAEDVNTKYKGSLSIESINARANAFSGVADAIKGSSDALDKADAMASKMDRFIDGWKTLWGGDLRTQFSKSFADGLVGALEAVPEGPMRAELEDKLKNITKAAKLDRTSILGALAKLSPEDLKLLGPSAAAVLKPVQDSLKQSQAITQDIKETAKAVNQSYLTLRNAVADKSATNVFLQDSLKESEAFKKSLEDTTKAQVALKALASGELKSEFLTQGPARAIMPLAQESAKLTAESENYANNLSKAKQRLSEIDAQLQDMPASEYLGNLTQELEAERLSINATIIAANKGIADIDGKVKSIAEQAKVLIQQSIVAQINQSLEQTRLRIAQISNQAEQSVVAKLPVKTEESIKYQADLQRQSIELERQMFKSQERLVRSIDLLAIQVQRDADLRELATLKADPNADGGAIGRMVELQKRIGVADRAVAAYDAQDLKTLAKLAEENPAVRALMASTAGIIEANKQFSTKLASIDLEESINKINLQFDKQVTDSENLIKQLNINIASLAGYEGESFREARAKLEAAVRAETAKQEALTPARQAAITAAEAPYLKGKGGSQVIAATQAKIAADAAAKAGLTAASGTVAGSTTDLENRKKSLAETNEIAKVGLDIDEQRARLRDDSAKSANTYAKEEIAFKQQLGIIDAESARVQLYKISLSEASIDKETKLREAELQRASAEAQYNVDLLAAGGKETDLLKARRELYESTYSTAVKGANQSYDAQVKLLQLQNSLTDKQKAYSDVFKKAFDSMGDAIVDFVKTGKLSFTSLISTMLEGLLRYELQLQTTAMYAAARPGIMGFLSSFLPGLGGLGASTTDYSLTSGTSNLPSMGGGQGLRLKAQGGVYDAGLELFAKGGAFTNSIVSSPTLFKFAQGTGLMGEAGPEAIMPLKRDANGNLGVRGAESGKVDVVVNNYSTAQATTKETTDSRGNRKIEVVIGEAAASDMGRSGSQSQKAMRTTFGIAPQLIRR